MSCRALFAAVVAVASLSSAAEAVPVSGQISIGGYAQAIGSTSMSMATGISFATYSTATSGYVISGNSGGLSSFGAGTGAFATLGSCGTLSSCGTIRNIDSFAASGPISQFLTLATGNGTVVSFDLTSINNVNRFMDSTGGSLALTATGTINYTGYDPTVGTFTLTGQGNMITSFSATTLATGMSVPEPMSLALLGSLLTVIGLVRRKNHLA